MKFDYKHATLKVGDIVVCDECDIELYKMVNTPFPGDTIKAGYFKSIREDVKDPIDNARFVCPKCKHSLYGLGGIRVKA